MNNGNPPVNPPAADTPTKRRVVLSVSGLVIILLFITTTAHHAREPLAGWLVRSIDEVAPPDSARLVRERASLKRRLDAVVPKGAYLLVSSTDNRFALMRGPDTLRAGLCSTGSYVRLTAGDGRSWLFSTPRGGYRVLEKRVNPVWSKPDWAFIEAGEPVPRAGAPERFERGVLGDYALSLGDGYLVHGTPYQRLLGTPVTHGCVRLGDEDLEAVFRAMPIGAPVILY